MSLNCGSRSCLSRRTLLTTSGAVGVAALTACAAPDGSAEEPPAGDGEPDGPIATVSEIPVGGALAATTASGEAILLTQPAEGEVHAFSSVCTHQGCTVAPGEGDLACPCHGSRFDLTTGEPIHGPATDPLPQIAIDIADNGDITG